MYIYTNARVLCQRPGADPVRWYDANILSEDSDPDALGPVSVGESNREFDAMRAQEEEDDDMEANRAPQEYRPNPDLWAQGANHLDEARNYYGDEDAIEEDLGDGRWVHGGTVHVAVPCLLFVQMKAIAPCQLCHPLRIATIQIVCLTVVMMEPRGTLM